MTSASTAVAPPRAAGLFRSAPLIRLLLIAGIILLERAYLGTKFSTDLRPQYLLLPFVLLVPLIRHAQLRSDLERLWMRFHGARFYPAYFAAHLLAVLICTVISWPGFETGTLSDSRVILAYGAYVAGVCFLLSAFFPVSVLIDEVRNAGATWLHALIGAIATWWLVGLSWSAWIESSNPLTPVTFQAVKIVLGLFFPQVYSDPLHLRLGSGRFNVTVNYQCSGVEGLALILVFCGAWLWYFRSEIRYPRAFVLLPAALLSMWMLNVGRIAGLILLGNAFGREVALGGFHSRAGWLAFNSLALVFCAVAVRSPWFRKDAVSLRRDAAWRNLTAVYLLPFLAILAASFVSRAFSGTFEWLYPLRFFAAAAVLWYFRADYRNIGWKFSWLSPVLGVLVFVAWVAWVGARGQLQNPVLAAGVASLAPAARLAWLALRIAGAVTAVPIAEELAFRGYAARRLMSGDFDLVDLRKLSALGVIGSSVLFGILHGNLWLVGILAGLVYAIAVRKDGRLADGIAAHATTNALLAAWVLWRGDWGLW